MTPEQTILDFSRVPPQTEAYARCDGPLTSLDAARSVRMTNLEQRVLSQLLALGDHGATTTELAMRLDLSQVTVSPRLAPLVKKGLVRDSWRRRPGPSGRSQIVWTAIP